MNHTQTSNNNTPPHTITFSNGFVARFSERCSMRIEEPERRDVEALLALNTGNRQINYGRIQMLAELIKGGRFIDDGDRIKVNIHGVLVDGQHRLMAMLKADTFPDFDVIFGIHQDSFIAQGNQLTRTPTQVLALAGIPNNKLAKAIYEIARAGEPDAANVASSSEGLLEWCQRHPEVQDVIKFVRNFRSPLLPLSLSAGFLYICHRHSHGAEAEAFLSFVLSGKTEELPSVPDSFALLRERLIKNAASKAKLGRRDLWALTVKGFTSRWNQSMKNLRWSAGAGEPLPRFDFFKSECENGCAACDDPQEAVPVKSLVNSSPT